jgi:hypothetical protein
MAYKVGDKVTVKRGPHAGQPHEIIHVHKDGSVNVKPHKMMPHQIKYRMGAAKAKPNEIKKMNEIAMSKRNTALINKIKNSGVVKTGSMSKDGEPVRKENKYLKMVGTKARVVHPVTKVVKKVDKKDLRKHVQQGWIHQAPRKNQLRKEEVQIDEIARSMTPMRDKFGKSKAEKEAEKKKKYPSHLTINKARKAFAPTKGGRDAKKEGTIITKPGFKLKPDDADKLKKIANLMKKQKVKRLRDWMEK